MSKVQLAGNASGTGIFQIASPNSNTDRTLTLPDETGTLLTSGGAIAGTTGTFSGAVSGTTGSFSGNMSFNSGYGSAAVAYGCRAWVNFNGTGTVAIRASGNVSSITDNGTGDYTINFTTAMPDTNYSVIGNSADTFTAVRGFNNYSGGQTTSSARVLGIYYSTGNALDNPYMFAAVFR